MLVEWVGCDSAYISKFCEIKMIPFQISVGTKTLPNCKQFTDTVQQQIGMVLLTMQEHLVMWVVLSNSKVFASLLSGAVCGRAARTHFGKLKHSFRGGGRNSYCKLAGNSSLYICTLMNTCMYTKLIYLIYIVYLFTTSK